jgi:hypothetical protein
MDDDRQSSDRDPSGLGPTLAFLLLLILAFLGAMWALKASMPEAEPLERRQGPPPNCSELNEEFPQANLECGHYEPVGDPFEEPAEPSW